MLTMDYAVRSDARSIDAFPGFLRSNPVGLFSVDQEGRLRNVNNRAAEMFGFEHPQAAEGRPLSQLEFFFSQANIDRIYGLLTGGEPFRIHCFPGTNLSGHFAYYCLSCNAAYENGSKPTGIFGVIEDVTDQMKQQQELKNRIDELSMLAQISQVVSSALDTEEVLKVILTGVTARQGLGFNRAFLFLLTEDGKTLTGRLAVGPSNSDEAGKIWSSLEHDNRSLFEILSLYQEEAEKSNRSLTDLIRDTRIDLASGSLFAEAMKTNTPIVIDENAELDYATDRLLTHMGEKRVAMTPLVSRDRAIGLLLVDNAITREAITDHDTRFLKLIADQTAAAVERSYLYRDIKTRAAELEESNRKLAETQNQIIEAERMSVIGEITSAVAHELRNPLTIIGGFAHLMYKNLEPGSPDGEYLNIVISETQRAEAVVTDVLDFSRASKTPDRHLELNQLVHNALDMLTVRLGRDRCSIRAASVGTALPLWGNPDQLLYALYQVFRSLMLDMPCEEVHVATCVQEAFGRVEIRFADGDKNRDKVEKLLKQYFSGGSNSKRLSLIVAEETLKHHGGWLGVESGAQGGPMLSIHLPLHKEAAHAQNSGG